MEVNFEGDDELEAKLVEEVSKKKKVRPKESTQTCNTIETSTKSRKPLERRSMNFLQELNIVAGTTWLQNTKMLQSTVCMLAKSGSNSHMS